MLRLKCLQLVSLGEENFYSITVGYTVVVCCASVVEFWGLPPLILLLQYVNRLGFLICSEDSRQSVTEF